MKLHVVVCALLAAAVAASPLVKAQSRSDTPVMRQMQESYDAVRQYRESLSPRQLYVLDSTNNWLDANYPNKMVPIINKNSVAYVAREIGAGDPADLVIIHATLRDHNQFLINADKVERALRSPYYSGGCLPGDADYPACLDE